MNRISSKKQNIIIVFNKITLYLSQKEQKILMKNTQISNKNKQINDKKIFKKKLIILIFKILIIIKIIIKLT
jgi:hypothetical protein